MASITFTKLGS